MAQSALLSKGCRCYVDLWKGKLSSQGSPGGCDVEMIERHEDPEKGLADVAETEMICS